MISGSRQIRILSKSLNRDWGIGVGTTVIVFNFTIIVKMKQKTAAYCVLGGTYSVVLIALISFIFARDNSIANYYWCWVWLCPFMIWNWVVIAWCDSELFLNSKRRLVS